MFKVKFTDGTCVSFNNVDSVDWCVLADIPVGQDSEVVGRWYDSNILKLLSKSGSIVAIIPCDKMLYAADEDDIVKL